MAHRKRIIKVSVSLCLCMCCECAVRLCVCMCVSGSCHERGTATRVRAYGGFFPVDGAQIATEPTELEP